MKKSIWIRKLMTFPAEQYGDVLRYAKEENLPVTRAIRRLISIALEKLKSNENGSS